LINTTKSKAIHKYDNKIQTTVGIVLGFDREELLSPPTNNEKF
jgi:hypothetical protein